MRKHVRLVIAAWFALFASFAPAQTTINVNTTTDGFVSGKVSLRMAVTNANNASSAIINVPAGTYTLSLGELDLGPAVGSGAANNILFLGAGSATTVITQSDGTSRVFDLDPNSGGGSTFAFANLTIAGGNDTASDPFGLQGDGGGGILTGEAGLGSSADHLNLTNCVFAHNKASGNNTGNAGAAVESDGGSVVIVGCTFMNNSFAGASTAIWNGAGLYFLAVDSGDTLTLINTVFQSNSISGSDNAQGGALSVDDGGHAPLANITNCVFGGNTITSTGAGGADFGGAALYIAPASTANIIGCTFTNNQANGTVNKGGAILCGENTTDLIKYCRFAGNSVASGGSGSQIYINSAGNNQGPFTALDNWWASDNGPASGSIVGTNTTTAKAPSNWLFLTNTASPTSVQLTKASSLTASFLKDSAGTAIAAANLGALTNLAVNFSGVDGSISGAQSVIQTAGTATATFTGTTVGSGSATATVDGASSIANITVTAATVSSVSSNPAGHNYKAGQTVPVTVTFSSAVAVTGTPHLSLSDGGTASYASGNGTVVLTFNYIVGAGDTSSHLDYASTSALTLNSGTISAGGSAAILTLPTPGAAGSLSASTIIVIDTTAPTISITSKPASFSPTNGPSFSFTDSDNGSGVATVQYQVDGGTLASATSPLQLSGVADGAHTFSLVVTDNAGNAGTSNYTWTVDTTAPAVTIGAPSVSFTNSSGAVTYNVGYSDANFSHATLTSAGITLATTGTASGAVTVTPGAGTSTTTNYTVKVASLTGDGTIGITVAGGTAADLAGNTNLASGPSATFTVDDTAPTVTIGAPSVSFTNSSGAVTYNVGYSDANFSHATLTSAGITLATTGTASGAVTVTPGAGTSTTTNYTVKVASLTGDGTIGITVAGGTAADLAGNTNLASGPSATFTVDDTAPTVTIGAPSVSFTNSSGAVTYNVGYSDANFSHATLTSAGITLATTGTASGAVTVTPGAGTSTTTNYTVKVASLTGDGTIGITVAGGTAADLAGNTNLASGPSATFTVDDTAPTVTISSPTPTATTNGSGVTVAFGVGYFDANFSHGTLGAGSITVTGTETAAGSVASVAGGAGSATGTNYTVTITNVTGFGALGISIASGTAVDLAGNLAPAAISGVPAKVMSVPFFTGDYIIGNRSYYEQAGLVLLVRSNGVSSTAQHILETSLYDSYSVARATNGDIYVACYQTPTAFYSSNTALDGGVYKIDQYSLTVANVASTTNFVTAYSTNLVTPFGLAVEPNGNILVADLDAYTNLDANFTDGTVAGGAVFRLNPVTGVLTVLSTNGPSTGSNFFFLGGITVGTNGGSETIYVTDHGDGVSKPKLIRIDPVTGVQTVLFSGAPLSAPDGLAVDPNGSSVTNLVVADSGGQALIEVSTNSTSGTWIAATVPVTGGSFTFPTHVAIDPGTGDFLVTDGAPASLANISAGTLWRVYRSDWSLHNWNTGGFFEQPRGILIAP